MNDLRGCFVKNRRMEWLALVLFLVSFSVVSFYHEPWFDEAQAWQIVKCASIQDILFEIPHYEGHLPLWHLLLAIPAKFGVPFELGLKVVAALPTMVAVCILLFRAPFPKVIRLLLPFHYFVFYQYGVVSRPYGLMLLAFLTLALTFREKDSRPWPFGLSLIFLCFTSAYGIVLTGGISLCWVVDIVKEYIGSGMHQFWKDKRVLVLLLVLLVALAAIAVIMPREDTYATGVTAQNSLLERLLYTCAAIIPDCFFSKLLPCLYMANAYLPIYKVLPVALLGVILLLGMIGCAGKKKGKYFLLPFLMLGVFFALIYGSNHHIGIVFLLILFWLWVNQEDTTRYHVGKKLLQRILIAGSLEKWIAVTVRCFVLVCMVVPIWWSVSAAILDVRYSYSCGREIAQFLKDSGLSDAKILAPWKLESSNGERDEKNTDFYEEMNTNHFALCTSEINAYFDKNIFLNLNDGKDEYAYLNHKRASKEENIRNLQSWKENGYPDVIFDPGSLSALFDDDKNLPRYYPVFKAKYSTIWKPNYMENKDNFVCLYLREDLVKRYGLKRIEG